MGNLLHHNSSNHESSEQRHIADGDGHRRSSSTETSLKGRFQQAAAERPLEVTLRTITGLIGLSLIVLTLQHISRPTLATEMFAVLSSVPGQWLFVVVLGICFLLGAIYGGRA